jgi:hypothetical protein
VHKHHSAAPYGERLFRVLAPATARGVRLAGLLHSLAHVDPPQMQTPYQSGDELDLGHMLGGCEVAENVPYVVADFDHGHPREGTCDQQGRALRTTIDQHHDAAP